ncbi:MAG TPA: prepilin-type N-terminal cleavage/methylation domain-containing protein [Pyrinomonadaceae bacterium]|nr:prepilin-type N-terminal cleavage/methylation domain-containing protein [Pyrinomonadaceae bacterium]
MTERRTGFSLIEVLVALSIGLCLTAMMFQLFHQNERVIRDQTLIMEMQQTARIVASQIAEEIRMAGQGVPVYASTFDTLPSEAVAVILESSNASRIDFRAGLSNAETSTDGGAMDFDIGVSQSLPVRSTSGFSPGKFVYVSGTATGSAWSWMRAEVTAVSSTTLTLIPRNTGTTDTTIHFAAAPGVSLEEAVSIYLSSGSVRRAVAGNTSSPSKPLWSAANEIGKNFTDLTFRYYDDNGTAVQPGLLSDRMRITRVDIQLTVVVAAPLSNGSKPTYSLALRTIPRNIRVHYAN